MQELVANCGDANDRKQPVKSLGAPAASKDQEVVEKKDATVILDS